MVDGGVDGFPPSTSLQRMNTCAAVDESLAGGADGSSECLSAAGLVLRRLADGSSECLPAAGLDDGFAIDAGISLEPLFCSPKSLDLLLVRQVFS